MKDLGNKIKKMDTEYKSYIMNHFIKETIKMENLRVMVSSFGTMGKNIKDHGIKD